MPVIQKTKYECFSRIVISSEVEKSSLQNDNRRMRESRNMPFGASPRFVILSGEKRRM